ncbi:M50 family metallopeptidase [Candidatus Woesearchaeota archaeon]|nr:M50 family metallopeptidase [Candidatus Woesearchaeota archaeon]
MAIITITEILALVIVSLYLGFIFSGLISYRIKTAYDYMHKRRFDSRDFWFAVLVAAPGVILHELAHKFVGLAFGLGAVFVPFYDNLTTLIVAGFSIVLKILASPFILIVPGFVSLTGNVTPPISLLTALAGPSVNLILWLGAAYILKKKHNVKRKTTAVLSLTAFINKWLFIFNMLPIPPLDGSKVLFGLIGIIS